MVIFRLASTAACLALLCSCGSSESGSKAGGKARPEPPQQPAALVIEMTSATTYNPSNATIKVNQTVEWVNRSTGPHTVTANPDMAAYKEDVVLPRPEAAFDSGEVPAGGVFRHTFTIPGSYKYFCKVHERGRMMIGQLTVQ